MRKVFLVLIIALTFFLLTTKDSLAGYCSGGECLPGPPPPGEASCTTNADCVSSSDTIFGPVNLPSELVSGYGQEAGAIIKLLNNILRLLITAGGIFAFFNLIIAGYGFLSAGDDPQKMANAWQKIWQSMLGLLFILGSFVLAAIFSYLLFGDPRTILNPKLYGPGAPTPTPTP